MNAKRASWTTCGDEMISLKFVTEDAMQMQADYRLYFQISILVVVRMLTISVTSMVLDCGDECSEPHRLIALQISWDRGC